MADGIEIRGVEKINAKLDKLKNVILDLRPLWEQFSSDFYKTEKKIFQLKGEGKYPQLSQEYSDFKERKYGFIFPLLFATGRLAGSLLSRSHVESINIIKKQSFAVGTSVPYAVYHHSDKPRKKIPYRPLWIDDDNSPMIKRWVRTADAYLDKAAKGAFK